MPRYLDRPLTVIAHRGASAYAPENTVPAFDLAVTMGADVVETDVQMTRDGQLVCVHDTTLARTTDARLRYPYRAPWSVGDLTLAEIRSLDAGSWFDGSFAGTRVPTLQETLEAVDGRAGLLLEFKRPALYPGIADAAVAELVRAGWLGGPVRDAPLVAQSFDWGFMGRFNALAPTVTAGLLGRLPSSRRMRELSGWASQVNPADRCVSARVVEAAHRNDLVVCPWTVDSGARMRELVALGVDGIITNRPDVLLDVALDSRQHGHPVAAAARPTAP